MKKSSRFLVGFAAAALTFGSLFAIAGPDQFGGPCGGHGKHHHHNSCHHHCGPGETSTCSAPSGAER